ncbi:MAG: hypothetical protein P8074_22585 [Anaerolineales bacterium]
MGHNELRQAPLPAGDQAQPGLARLGGPGAMHFESALHLTRCH